MQQFIHSCEKQSTRHREMNEETGNQDDKRASTGTLKEAGALGQPEIHNKCEGSTYQPRTSTPKKNTLNPPTAVIIQTGPKRAGGDGPLPEEGALAWPTREGREEAAELCLSEVQPHPEDEGSSEEVGQEEVRSEAGDLLAEDGPASQALSSNHEITSSINWNTDAALGNMEGIKKLQESQRAQSVKAGILHSKSMNEIESLKERIKTLEADKEVANKGVEAWQIPFSDLKRNSISSKIFQTPSGGSFQAKLFLNGVSKLGSSRLSLVVSEASVSSAAAAADKALKYKCRVQLVNLRNVADSIQEEHELQRGVFGAATGKNEAKFLTLVPIKMLEDQSRGFVMNGVLQVILTFEEI